MANEIERCLTLRKPDDTERGSIILVLLIAIVMMTTATVLIEGTLSEFLSDRNRQNDIVARYAAEAGAEQYLYEVVCKLNEQKAYTLRSESSITPPLMTGSTNWEVEDESGSIEPIRSDLSYYTYLDISEIDDNNDFGWTSTSPGNRLPDGGFFLLNPSVGIAITNNSSEEESASFIEEERQNPKIYLPTIPEIGSEPVDSFQLRFTVTAQTAAGISRDLEVTSGFNVKLKENHEEYSQRFYNGSFITTMEWEFELLK
ncbi:hypothetical protein GTO91_15900 [Heliobacterium undosum]|uniref:Uncharacterized protein n=1 Tax=Heliomicrobium undosum TaxID=121734 RepID=A0A845LE48_9FIRM|nr:pilus assembly PilX N-terminal domain-containing protein [Heliomicrobium undosum]MZP31191.1 hypothetical protein [Heliomicrobium undosum]